MPTIDAALVKAFSDAGPAALLFFALIAIIWVGSRSAGTFAAALREVVNSFHAEQADTRKAFQEQVATQHAEIRTIASNVVDTVHALDVTVQGVVRTVEGLNGTVQRLDDSVESLRATTRNP